MNGKLLFEIFKGIKFLSSIKIFVILSMRSFHLTVMSWGNIRFFRELSENNSRSLFMHPYLKMLKEFNEQYGVKIQLNLFYQDTAFNLSSFSEQYRKEWKDNADWLKMSFHSKLENPYPYESATYEQVYNECNAVQSEILRFAGSESLAATTTIHCTKITAEGLNALKNLGVKGLLGLYGNSAMPKKSYLTSEADSERIRAGEIVSVDKIAYAGIDVILNCFSCAGNLRQLQNLQDRDVVKIMIHEQYFYEDYAQYQADFRKKLEQAFEFLIEKGFVSCFFEELL